MQTWFGRLYGNCDNDNSRTNNYQIDDNSGADDYQINDNGTDNDSSADDIGIDNNRSTDDYDINNDDNSATYHTSVCRHRRDISVLFGGRSISRRGGHV